MIWLRGWGAEEGEEEEFPSSGSAGRSWLRRSVCVACSEQCLGDRWLPGATPYHLPDLSQLHMAPTCLPFCSLCLSLHLAGLALPAGGGAQGILQVFPKLGAECGWEWASMTE